MASSLVSDVGLSLVVLYARCHDAPFDPAAVRWLSRFATQRAGLRLAELQLAAAAAHRPETPDRCTGRMTPKN
jgi:hypothetical protein